jgi:hypothetical protein
VLVGFGADWCVDCQALARRDADAAVKLVLQRDFRLVTVEVGHYDRNGALAARWIDLKRSGIPALVVLNPDGSVWATTQDGSFANAHPLLRRRRQPARPVAVPLFPIMTRFARSHESVQFSWMVRVRT